uniref:CSab-Lyc-1 n=1 Tax=Lychas buchari TaxID=1330406 RepID=T1DMT5_9SCOR
MIKLLLLLSTVTAIVWGQTNEVKIRGQFPMKLNTRFYTCEKDDYCMKVCKRHRVSRGFCIDRKCFCKNLSSQFIYYRDLRFHECIANFYDYDPTLKQNI